MHDRCCLARKIDPGFAKQSELLKIMIKIVCAKPQSQFDKYRVTGIHNSLGKGLRPVSCRFMTSDPAVLHDFISGTVKRIVHCHHLLFQCRSRGNDLEGRSRFVSIIDTGISPHLIQKILLFFLRNCRFHIQGKRIIEIILRLIDHGQYLTILRIHQDYRHTVCRFFLHYLLCCLLTVILKIIIQADGQLITCYRLYPALAFCLQFFSRSICLRQDFSVCSCQPFFIFDFQAHNSLIVSTGKTNHFGSQCIIGIISAVIRIYFHTVQVIRQNHITCLFRHIRTDSFDGTHLFHPFSHGFFRQLQFPAQYLYHLLRIRQLTVDHGYGTDRLIICQHNAVTVCDFSPGRFDTALPFVQILCLFLIILRLKYHKIDQPPKLCTHDCHNDQHQCHNLLFLKCLQMLHKKPQNIPLLYGIPDISSLCSANILLSAGTVLCTLRCLCRNITVHRFGSYFHLCTFAGNSNAFIYTCLFLIRVNSHVRKCLF